jgi:hypothetical protein
MPLTCRDVGPGGIRAPFIGGGASGSSPHSGCGVAHPAARPSGGGPGCVLLSARHFGEGAGIGPSVIDAVRNRDGEASLCPWRRSSSSTATTRSTQSWLRS